MKRKERMIRIRTEMLSLIEHQESLNLNWFISKCMFIYGISKRDSRDEINALIEIDNLKNDEGVLRNEK